MLADFSLLIAKNTVLRNHLRTSLLLQYRSSEGAS